MKGRGSPADLCAIGCGPFNLGLAALASTVPDLHFQAFEQNAELRWHPGLMFDDARLQLSFMADLVTLIEPSHPLSFLAYLKDVDRMYAFYVREEFHPTRREYEAYLRWAAAKLPQIAFGHGVREVAWDDARDCFVLRVERGDGSQLQTLARNLVLGIGTEPWLPEALRGLPASRVFHASEYLHRQRDLAVASDVTVIGSGQSGAEVVLDLLQRNLQGGPAVRWWTRTASFAPLDYTKLVLEMTTPAYIRYFHGLPQPVKDRLVREHWQLYKGISSETLAQIHGLLYERELRTGLRPVELRCGVALESASCEDPGCVTMRARHLDSGQHLTQQSALVIAATGYRERAPEFLQALQPRLHRDELGRTKVRLDYSVELDPGVRGRIFVANADLHSHGVSAPDLGVCAYRNATIINAVLGREVYRLPRRTAFTSFAQPEAREAGAGLSTPHASAAPRAPLSRPSRAHPAPGRDLLRD
jgi:lysine N6-hydroxylase